MPLLCPTFYWADPERQGAHCCELARSSCYINRDFVSLNLLCFDAKLEIFLSPPPTLSWSSLEFFPAQTSDHPAGREGGHVDPTSLTPCQDAGSIVWWWV